MLNQQLGLPGTRPAQFTTAREIFWGGDASRQKILRGQGQFSATLRDAGSTPTTEIRQGLLLGALTADSKLVHWDPVATDGSQFLRGVNEHEIVMVEGAFASAAERFGPVVLQGPVRAAALLVLGVALNSSPHQYLARRRLAQMGFQLDDDPLGYLAGITPRTITRTVTGPILATENGATFNCEGAAARTLTLPTIASGLSYRFVNGVNQNLIIAGAANIVALNNAAANSITFSTAGQLIGATVSVYSDFINGALRWVSTVEIGAATIA
jgi:hypothetical protein